MAKILLVEDDQNLQEIYHARLQAEGYQIVTASDGEEALAAAVRERPDVIILDVMMPKISGFDVLDMLRHAPETATTKVIMMTALSTESDQEKGKKLGASRYLVKSQITLEDVVAAVEELLEGGAAAPGVAAPMAGTNIPSSAVAAPAAQPMAPAQPMAAPVQPAPAATDDLSGVLPSLGQAPPVAAPVDPTAQPQNPPTQPPAAPTV